MTKFKVGDKFIPRKPKKNNTGLIWRESMDKYDGKELTVDGIDDFGRIQAEESGFMFHPGWCEKVEYSDHIHDLRKTIDWEQRKYELAKDFGCAAIIGYINSNTDWQPDIEAKKAVKQADEMIKQLKEQ